MSNNLVILTMSEDQYRSLLNSKALEDCQHTVKILPDDSELKDHEQYQSVKKAYRKAREIKEQLAFDLTTNNPKPTN